MRITPIINADFIYRYTTNGNKVVDTLTNAVIVSLKDNLQAKAVLQKTNHIGMLNGHIVDYNSHLPKAKQTKLLDYVA